MNNISIKYANAYKEIYEILKIFPAELIKKVPENKLDFYKSNMNKNYNYKITKENFADIPMMEETKAILANLFRDYWATSEQRKRILKKEQYDRFIIEKKKSEQYNAKWNL